ncbi:MAG TPA: glycogen debranching N-terminal domain-containing protein, partial [Acidimicrobiales bacterium]|nr:glycogen debranching N-terminal domain-containing protein [Acidimicrobiales bacterium]
MADPWTSLVSVSLGGPGDRVTLVEGSAFVICSPGGEMFPDVAHGLFFRDTRFLSRWSLRINGEAPESLARSLQDPYAATFVARTHP